MKRTPWQDRIILLAAVWLIASPYVLGPRLFAHPATVAALVCAAMLISCAAEAPPIPDIVAEWVTIAVGFAFAASPWLLEYTGETSATLNAVGVGLLVAACALSALVSRYRILHSPPEAGSAPGSAVPPRP